jgi:hypothetical protein
MKCEVKVLPSTGNNIKLLIKNARLSFANLARPKERTDAKTKQVTGYSYELNALVPKADTEAVEALKEAVRKALAARWGDNPPKIPADRRCLRDGEPKDEDSGKPAPLYDGYAGCVYISASQRVDTKDQPCPVQLLDSRKGADGKFPRLTPAEVRSKLYSGAYADVVISIYGFDGSKNEVPNRVNASLEAVKFVAHGDAFGAKAVDADALFDEEPADELDAPAAPADVRQTEDDMV